MKLFNKHVIFDEITYDREELEAFVNRFKDCVVNYSKWQETNLEDTESAWVVPTGYNIVDTRLLEGKAPYEYPEIKK